MTRQGQALYQRELNVDDFWWLVIANAVVWLGLGAYLAFLGIVQKNQEKALQGAKLTNDD